MKIYLRILSYLRPYAPRVVLALLATALFAVFSGISVGMVIPFSHVLFRQGVMPTPDNLLPDAGALLGKSAEGEAPVPFSSAVVDVRERVRQALVAWFQASTPMKSLERVCVGMLLLFLVKSVLGYLQAFLNVWLEQALIRDLRNDLFAHITRLSLSYFHARKSGEIISRIIYDVALARQAVNSLFTVLVRDLALALVYVVIVFWVNWRLALLTFLVLPPVAVLVSRLGARLRRHSTISQERMEEVTSIVQETVGGMRIVKAFGMEEHERAKFRREAQAFFRAVVRMTRIGAVASPLTELMAITGSLFIFWYGGRQVLAGRSVHAEWFIIFLLAMIAMMRPVKNLTSVAVPLQEGVAAGVRIFRDIDRVPAISDRPGARSLARVEREIVFENVSFAYEGGPLVLRDVSLRVARGQVLAIVGPSGAGKSTLVDLLPRFYDPAAGRITVDGVDLRDIQVASLRRLMGTVSQETILFNDTVASNIAFGSPQATAEEIEAAARTANAHEFITELVDGYQTMVGDRGVKLSGGQRQRLAIARAILRNPQILIFDEATSALDSESELLVQEAIDRLLAHRTTFVIAHRLSTIQHADHIVVLDEGRLVEQGSHQELLARGGLYRRLYQMQFRTGQPEGEVPAEGLRRTAS